MLVAGVGVESHDVREDFRAGEGGVEALVVVVGVALDNGALAIAGEGEDAGMGVDAREDGEGVGVEERGELGDVAEWDVLRAVFVRLVGLDVDAELACNDLSCRSSADDDLTVEVLYAFAELLVGFAAARGSCG